jgi:NADH-ubiquinone oxidoreductase chain 6
MTAFNGYTLDLNNALNDLWYNNYTDYINKIFKKTDSVSEDVYFVSSKIWDGNLAESTHIASIGNIMYTNYSMWLIITSVILLLAMVGAIVITIKQKN